MTDTPRKIQKTEAEWQDQLTSEQYRVTRMKGTESPFSGEYHDSKEEGIYRCVACGTPLFSSESTYDSGTGRPRLWGPVGGGHRPLRALRHAPLLLREQVRLGDRLADLLGAGGRGQHRDGGGPHLLLYAPDGGPLRRLRRPPGPRLRGRPAAHGPALLHKLRRPRVRPGGRPEVTRPLNR